MLSYIKAMGKYADFGGRSTRREFWGFLITHSVLWGVIIYLLKRFPNGVGNNVMIAVSVMYFALTVVPSVAIAFRRWHDLGRSGAWVLLNLVPVIGSIVTLCFFMCKGDGFHNRYGADPYSKKYRRK